MRKTKEITISAEGRDKNKTFLLTEMDAFRAEKWGARALNGLARANVEIPDTVAGAGIVGVFVMGLKMLFAMDFSVAEPLLDEMMGCVQYVHAPGIPPRPIIGANAVDGDVEEPMTLVRLREEVFALHTSFTVAEAVSKLTSVMSPLPTSSNTSTSQEPSAPSSHPEKRRSTSAKRSTA
jgi:hypothetical protein